MTREKRDSELDLDEEDDPAKADVSGEIKLPPTVESTGQVPERAEIAIVGGGVIGLSIAYHLAKRGLFDVVVLERGYLAEGASGRNGGGVRQQWSTEINIRLMQESVDLCRRFAVDLGVNVWFRQGGYLFLARSAKELARLERNCTVQNKFGVDTKMLEPELAREIVPELDLTGIVGAAYNSTDGILFPWPFCASTGSGSARRDDLHADGRGARARRAGGLRPPRGAVRARRVINATGAWSPTLAEMMIGVDPDYPIRHEICSSEYQAVPAPDGVGAGERAVLLAIRSARRDRRRDPARPRSTTRWAAARSGSWRAYAPAGAADADPRQRQGAAAMGPGRTTSHPMATTIVGAAPGIPTSSSRFVGHGFMMAPIVGKLYGEWLTGGARHIFATLGRASATTRARRTPERASISASALTPGAGTRPVKLAGPIGFIGAGNMAGALIRNLVRGSYVGERVTASPAQRTPRAGESVRRATADNRKVARANGLIVLAVKPQLLATVLEEINDQLAPNSLIVSIAAGVPTEALGRAARWHARGARDAHPN